MLIKFIPMNLNRSRGEAWGISQKRWQATALQSIHAANEGLKSPKGRNISGILLLDKPVKLTSNGALQIVKRLFQAQKAGHTGSLDPFATGILPLCLGEATKIAGFLIDTDKQYCAVCKLGLSTTTGDTEGDIIEQRAVPEFTHAHIEQVLAEFTGEIEQVPPMFSAIKQAGQPLYKLARKGITVERVARPVHIRQLTLLSLQHDLLELDVQCSKGTYIRTLAADIGARLGCGAHLNALRRTRVGDFTEAQTLTLDQLSQLEAQGKNQLDAVLLPMQNALPHWPELSLTDDAAYYLCQGQSVFVPQRPGCGWVKLYAPDQRFLGLGEVLQDGRVVPRRLLNKG